MSGDAMGRRCNIAYLHNKTGISGGERSLLGLWQYLDTDRFKPYLIVPGEGRFSAEAKKAGIEIVCLEIPRLRMANFFKIIKASFALAGCLKKNKINIIHSYTPRNNILSALAGKILGIPVVWHERNLVFGDETDVTRRFLFLPDRIICNSRAVAQRFNKRGQMPFKVKVILNGVDLDRFNPAAIAKEEGKELSPGRGKVLGIIANFSRRKRLEYFLEAASLISKRLSDVMFLVVGGGFADEDGGRLEFLKNRANELEIDDRVRFTGFMEDITGALASFDVSAHVTRKEACSRAIIESMAAGKPVVAMNDGGNPELVENGITGVLTPPDDIESFVRATEELLTDDAERKEMGKRARERAEKLFDVKRNALETQQVYMELIGNGKE